MKESRDWKLLFYESVKGECPVHDFIESLNEGEQVKVISWLKALKQEGINLHRPFADLLEDGIHELRIKITGDHVRVLYFFCHRDYIIMTHTFFKRTDKVPKKELKKAKNTVKIF
jgi:phage-related protein